MLTHCWLDPLVQILVKIESNQKLFLEENAFQFFFLFLFFQMLVIFVRIQWVNRSWNSSSDKTITMMTFHFQCTSSVMCLMSTLRTSIHHHLSPTILDIWSMATFCWRLWSPDLIWLLNGMACFWCQIYLHKLIWSKGIACFYTTTNWV